MDHIRSEKGALAIEFLGIIPLCVLLLLAIWQVALAGFAILNTNAAARDGARVCATTKDPERAKAAAESSFGDGNHYYSLNKTDFPDTPIDAQILGDTAQVTVHTAIYPIILPKEPGQDHFKFTFNWTVTAPIYQATYTPSE